MAVDRYYYQTGVFMPKHKLDKDNDLLDDVNDALDEFVAMLKRFKKKNTPIQQAHAKVKKVAEKVDDAWDDLVYQAKAAAKDVKEIAKDLIDEPTADEKALRDLKKAGDAVEYKINRVLKQASRLAKEVKTALVALKDAIVEAFKSLGSTFKSIFSTAVPHGAPVLTHHHQKGKNQHLDNEKAFRAKQSTPAASGVHLKILSSKGKK